MKKGIFFAVIACMLMGCHSDIDLGNVDTRSQLDVGVALPVGSIHFTLEDLLGKVDKLYLDTLDHKGVITWRDTFPDGRSYHKLDLKDRISTKTFPLDVYAQLASYATGGVVYGTGMPITLTFDMPLTLNKINDILGDERLDSAYIDEASFITTLSTSNFDIEWDWIEEVKLDLGAQITRPKGHEMVVHRVGDPGTGFNRKMETSVDNFTLCMMKDRTKAPGNMNILQSTTFKVYLTIRIPVGESVMISNTPGMESKLDYDLSVKFIKYKAIWGFFKPSSDMFAEVLTPIGDSWKSIGFIKNGNMPFSEPYIKVDIETQIAGIMRIDSCYVFSENADGERTYAEFFADHQIINRNIVLQGTFLDPHTSPIGASTTLFTEFDKTSIGGRIDRLFGKLPENVGYKFKVDFDTDRSPQVRMTPDDSININAICTLPMIFHNGAYFCYNDTTHNVNLSQFTLDSLLGHSNLVDTIHSSDLKMFMQATNDMPVSVSLKMRCLDEKDNVIMDPTTGKPFILFEQDSTRIESAKYTPEHWDRPDKVTETALIASLDKKRMDLLPKVKTLVYIATVDDKSMQEAYSAGYHELPLRGEKGLTIRLGLTANVDAILKFDKK